MSESWDAARASALFLAAERGERFEVGNLLRKGPPLPQGVLVEAFRRAATKNHVDVVRVLLKHGLDPNAEIDGVPLLYWSVSSIPLQSGLLELLVDSGAHAGTQPDRSPLPWLVGKADYPPLEDRPRLYPPDACARHLAIVLRLIRSGATVDAVDQSTRTALSWAAERRPVEAARALLESGADPNRVDFSGNSPLYYAAARGDEGKDIVRLLLERGAAVDDRNRSGLTPRSAAAGRGDASMLELLDSSRATAEGLACAFLEAAAQGQLAILRNLLHRVVPVDARDPAGETALHRASRNRHNEVARLLIERGAPLDARSGSGAQPIHSAAMGGNVDLVAVYLSRGIPVDARGPWNATPLILAAGGSHRPLVELLLARGANVNAVADFGGTAVMAAVDPARYNVAPSLAAGIVRYLIDRGAAIDARNGDGETALMLACGARDCTRDPETLGKIEVVEALLSGGADRRLKDHAGKMALDHARRHGYREIVTLLERTAGA